MKTKPGGSAALATCAARRAILRELWQWREREAQAADRPPFHILQNHLLLQAAKDFEGGEDAGVSPSQLPGAAATFRKLPLKR